MNDDESRDAPAPSGDRESEVAQVAISAFLVVVVGAIAFSNSLNIPFHYDTRESIVQNPALHRIATLSDDWKRTGLRPLTALSMALNWGMGSGSPASFRGVNLCIHLLNAILVFLLCRRLLRRRAPEPVSMAGGMVFALHPAVTQGVIDIAHRSVLLTTFFILLSIVLYLRATDDEKQRHPGVLAASLACFALAWASGAMAWIVPLLLLPLDAAARKGVGLKRRAIDQGLFWALLVLLIVGHRAALPAPERVFNSDQVLAQAGATETFLRLTVFPTGLSAEHAPYTTSDIGLPTLWLGFLCLSVVVVFFLPMPGAGMVWFALAIVAPSFFVADGAFREERLYFPLIGAVFFVPWLLNAAPGPRLKTAAGIAAAALVFFCGGLTFMRNQVWQSELDLWTDAAANCPECPGAPERLGALYMGQAERAFQAARAAVSAANESEAQRLQAEAMVGFEQAESSLLRATEFQEASARTWYRLGRAQRHLGKAGPAREAMEKALEANPMDQATTLELALLLEMLAVRSGKPQDVQRATDYYRRAEQLGDLPDEGLLRYGALLARIGALRESEARLLRLEGPGAVEAGGRILPHVQAGIQTIRAIHAQIGDRLAANPNDPEIVILRARQLLLEGKSLQSAYLLEMAFRESPPTLNAWLLLGLNKAKMGAFEGFVEQWPNPPAGEGGESSWLRMAKACAETNAWDAALAALEGGAPIQDGRRPPLIALGDIALELGQQQRASSFFRNAAEERPTDPEPWLRLCDMALAAGDLEAARRFVVQAETRGAAESVLAERRKQAGAAARGTQPVQRTIIR